MRVEPPETWSAAQRRLHWLVASGVLCAFILSAIMTRIGDDQLLAKFVLYQLHKTIGLLVLAGALARLVLLVRRGRPRMADVLPPLNRRSAQAAHALLYALLLIVPLLGYLTNSTSPSRIPVLFMMVIPLPNVTPASEIWNGLLHKLHHSAAIILFFTALGHAAMAVIHHGRGSPILRRMWRG